MGGRYTEKNGYIFWEPEWAKIQRVAVDKLNREHPANSVAIGTKADIYGNIITNGSPAFFEVVDFAGINIWNPL